MNAGAQASAFVGSMQSHILRFGGIGCRGRMLHRLLHLRNLLLMLRIAGNKSDDDYIREGAELKALIAKAEQDAPLPVRDLSHLKRLLEDDFIPMYSSFTPEEKRDFWKDTLTEIKVKDNIITDVVFRE